MKTPFPIIPDKLFHHNFLSFPNGFIGNPGFSEKKEKTMKTEDRTESEFPVLENQERKTILLLRWILIVVVGYLIVFSNPGRSLVYLPYGLFLFYVLSNLLLILFPRRWFEKDLFLFLILLADIGMTSLAAYATGRIDSEFYLIYFLILFIASYSRKPKFLYFTAGLLLFGYAFYSVLENPEVFREPFPLLRFSFIFVVSFFFHLMIESYNRVRREKDLLKEDYRELEILSELAQSIGQDQRLAEYLVRLNQVLCQKLEIERCMSILVDKKGKEARICFPDDTPETELTVINLETNPSFRESLQQDLEEFATEAPTGPKGISQYRLKRIPLSYHEEKVGTLYLRVNTPKPKLTHREHFFLNRLARITATAIVNLEKTE